MPFIAYLDESGDPSLGHVDHAFPVFSLALVIVDTEIYTTHIVPAVYRFKFNLRGHEGVILHSRDIRKGQGGYAFLTDPAKRLAFYEKLNAVVTSANMTVVGIAVQKEAHLTLHGERAPAPYDVALRFAFERLLLLVEDCQQHDIVIVAESRTTADNETLCQYLQQLILRGTATVAASRFQAVQLHLESVPKNANVIGTQLADLMADPIARYAVQPERANPAFDLIEPKLWRRDGERIGLAIYPTWSSAFG